MTISFISSRFTSLIQTLSNDIEGELQKSNLLMRTYLDKEKNEEQELLSQLGKRKNPEPLFHNTFKNINHNRTFDKKQHNFALLEHTDNWISAMIRYLSLGEKLPREAIWERAHKLKVVSDILEKICKGEIKGGQNQIDCSDQLHSFVSGKFNDLLTVQQNLHVGRNSVVGFYSMRAMKSFLVEFKDNKTSQLLSISPKIQTVLKDKKTLPSVNIPAIPTWKSPNWNQVKVFFLIKLHRKCHKVLEWDPKNKDLSKLTILILKISHYLKYYISLFDKAPKEMKPYAFSATQKHLGQVLKRIHLGHIDVKKKNPLFVDLSQLNTPLTITRMLQVLISPHRLPTSSPRKRLSARRYLLGSGSFN